LSVERIDRTSCGVRSCRTARPAGEAGRRWARNALEETLMRFAKAASVVAIVLSGVALGVGSGDRDTTVHVATPQVVAQR